MRIQWPRLVLLVLALCVCVHATLGSPERALRGDVDPAVKETVATGANASDPHVITDAQGDVWHVLDGSHPHENPTHTVIVTPATSSPAPSTSTDLPHSSSVELKSDGNESSMSSSTSASSAATPHHKTPMTGYIIVGAIAIVCVGVAAGIAKRKQAAAAEGHSDHH